MASFQLRLINSYDPNNQSNANSSNSSPYLNSFPPVSLVLQGIAACNPFDMRKWGFTLGQMVCLSLPSEIQFSIEDQEEVEIHRSTSNQEANVSSCEPLSQRMTKRDGTAAIQEITRDMERLSVPVSHLPSSDSSQRTQKDQQKYQTSPQVLEPRLTADGYHYGTASVRVWPVPNIPRGVLGVDRATLWTLVPDPQLRRRISAGRASRLEKDQKIGLDYKEYEVGFREEQEEGDWIALFDLPQKLKLKTPMDIDKETLLSSESSVADAFQSPQKTSTNKNNKKKSKISTPVATNNTSNRNSRTSTPAKFVYSTPMKVTPGSSAKKSGSYTHPLQRICPIHCSSLHLSHFKEASVLLIEYNRSSINPAFIDVICTQVRGKLLSRGSFIFSVLAGLNVMLRIQDVMYDVMYDKQNSTASNAQTSNIHTLALVTHRTDVRFKLKQDLDNISTKLSTPIGGLCTQINEIMSYMRAAGMILDDTQEAIYRDAAGILPPKGILLYGQPGSGKTSLAAHIANRCGVSFHAISGPDIIGSFLGESEKYLILAFEKAKWKSPCILLLDEVDALGPRRDSPFISESESRLTVALMGLIDSLTSDSRVFILATTNRPEALDPALRRPGRFDKEIEIQVPSSEDRFHILKAIISKAPEQTVELLTDHDVKSITDMAHGFVGADLSAVWREAVILALQADNQDGSRVSPEILREALGKVKPSALREVVAEIPFVSWTDVGGQDQVKEQLKEAVEWPLKAYTDKFTKIGVHPPRGILMFGPPGCSKTLMAKAVACEAKVNFISVQGPELLSKWVGDSEKAVQSAFKKARSTAPCVLFFDEIDALAPKRQSQNIGAESRVLSQLLTEMDGITALDERVVVIAATNRPDLIDPALLRPGRMDKLFYVGLPDEHARREILKIHTRKTPLIKHRMEVIDRLCGFATQGYSGAELAALVREATMNALEENLEHTESVTWSHFETALSVIKPRTSSHLLQFYEDYIRSAKGVVVQ